MANSKPQPKRAKHGHELVQRSRAAVLNAFDAVENRGKVLSEILADEFEKNPIKFMELASKLMPKEIHGDFNHSHSEIESLSNDELKSRIAEAQRLIDSINGDIEPAIDGDGEETSKGIVH